MTVPRNVPRVGQKNPGAADAQVVATPGDAPCRNRTYNLMIKRQYREDTVSGHATLEPSARAVTTSYSNRDVRTPKPALVPRNVPRSLPEQKYCPRCDQTLPRDAFGTRVRRQGLSLQPYCRSCQVTYHKRWRATPEGHTKFSIASNASKRRYPQRLRARTAVRTALKKGRLVRGVCVIGGDCDGDIHAHHDDYSKPLDVRWVCRKHHARLDDARRARNGATKRGAA